MNLLIYISLSLFEVHRDGLLVLMRNYDRLASLVMRYVLGRIFTACVYIYMYIWIHASVLVSVPALGADGGGSKRRGKKAHAHRSVKHTALPTYERTDKHAFSCNECDSRQLVGPLNLQTGKSLRSGRMIQGPDVGGFETVQPSALLNLDQ